MSWNKKGLIQYLLWCTYVLSWAYSAASTMRPTEEHSTHISLLSRTWGVCMQYMYMKVPWEGNQILEQGRHPQKTWILCFAGWLCRETDKRFIVYFTQQYSTGVVLCRYKVSPFTTCTSNLQKMHYILTLTQDIHCMCFWIHVFDRAFTKSVVSYHEYTYNVFSLTFLAIHICERVS